MTSRRMAVWFAVTLFVALVLAFLVSEAEISAPEPEVEQISLCEWYRNETK